MINCDPFLFGGSSKERTAWHYPSPQSSNNKIVPKYCSSLQITRFCSAANCCTPRCCACLLFNLIRTNQQTIIQSNKKVLADQPKSIISTAISNCEGRQLPHLSGVYIYRSLTVIQFVRFYRVLKWLLVTLSIGEN